MNRRKAFLLSGAAVLAPWIGNRSGWGSILIAPAVTGTITSISGVEAVTIDGHLYYVKAGSAAAVQLPALSAGQLVDVYLDGPANSSASQIVSITPHASQTGQ